MSENTAPEPAPEPPTEVRTGWRDRVFGLRGVVAVGLATLVLGGAGGAAIATIAHHDDDRSGWGRVEQGELPGGPGPRGFGQEARPGVVPPTTAPEDDTQPDAPTGTPASGANT